MPLITSGGMPADNAIYYRRSALFLRIRPPFDARFAALCLQGMGQAIVQEFMLRALDNMKADEESYIRQ